MDDFYWQVLFGVQVPLLGVNVDFLAYYPFEEWGKVDEIDLDDVEFGAWLNFSF